ncbi:MAG: DUF4421 domain-containing protein [Prevotellaceae bacterium]|jgi:hypothetical protein|nr:DUF4421 domain-containing protein [Prevotellaceae bacterium]
MKAILKLSCIFLFLIFWQQLCKAESDSLYIKPFKNQLILSAYYGGKILMLDYEYGNGELQSYIPNTASEVGVGIAWNWLAVSAKLYGFQPNSKYGKTTSFDFQSHLFFSKIQLSLSLQNYKGFYTEDENDNNAIIIRPDLQVKQYYLFSQYLFNHKKFSYMSAFSYDEQQLKSAGSLKAGIGVYYSSVSCDSSLILGAENRGGRKVIEDLQIGPNLGYVHTFVFWRRCFFTSAISVSLGISVKNNNDIVKLFPVFYPRIAFGYNGNNWTVGISAHFSRSYISKIGDMRTSINSGIVQLTFTYRLPFDIKKILYKTK